MQIDQLHERLNSDPDNVELARQLWNALLREKFPASQPLLDVTDSSAKTWKLINKLLAVCDQETRGVLIDSLRPILRRWPRATRPLIQRRGQSGPLTIDSIFETEIWRLADTFDFRQLSPRLTEPLAVGHSELTTLIDYYDGITSTQPATDQFRRPNQFGPLPRLSHLTTVSSSPFVEFLASQSEAARDTRSTLQSLDLTMKARGDINRVFSYPEFRRGLETLKIEGCHSPDLVFTRQWPDLRRLQLNLEQVRAFDHQVDLNKAKLNFPKLVEIIVVCDAVLVFDDPQRREDSEVMFRHCEELIGFVSELANLRFRLSVDRIAQTILSPNQFPKTCYSLVTDWTLDMTQGYFIPEMGPVSKSVTIEGKPARLKGLDRSAVIAELARHVSGLKRLVILDQRMSAELLASLTLDKFINLDSLTVNLVEPSSSQVDCLSQSLKRLNLKQLDLSFMSTKERVSERLEIPNSVQNLTLRALDDQTLETLIQNVQNLRKLEVQIEDHDFDWLRPVLSHPNCKSLEVLAFKSGSHSFCSRIGAEQIEIWKKIKLDQLQTIECRGFTAKAEEFLLNHFSSLTSII